MKNQVIHYAEQTDCVLSDVMHEQSDVKDIHDWRLIDWAEKKVSMHSIHLSLLLLLSICVKLCQANLHFYSSNPCRVTLL